MARIAVVLPAPFGPKNPSNVPGVTSNEQSSRATTSPYRFDNSLRRSMGVDPRGTPMQHDRGTVTLRRMRGQVLRIATPARRTVAGHRRRGPLGRARGRRFRRSRRPDRVGGGARAGRRPRPPRGGEHRRAARPGAPAGPARRQARRRTARRRGAAGGRQGHRRRRDRRVHHGARSRRAARGGAGRGAARHRRRLLPGDRHRDRRVGGGRPRRPVRPRWRALGEADRRLAPQGAWGVAQLRRGGSWPPPSTVPTAAACGWRSTPAPPRCPGWRCGPASTPSSTGCS